MLNLLRKIIQEVAASPDLEQALAVAATSIKAATETEACSIFISDQATAEHILLATDGLNPEFIKKLRLKFGEGLVGLVAEREEPINLDIATQHASFVSHPGTGEEKYKAFLGVPITYQRQVKGILVVQQSKPRKFDEAEEAFLVTLSTQLAGKIAQAEAQGYLQKLRLKPKPNSFSIDGIPSSPGIGIGQALVIYPLADLNSIREKVIEDIEIEAEIAHLHSTLLVTQAEIERISESLSSQLASEERALFDAYKQILASQSLIDAMETEIKENKYWAPYALKKVIQARISHFESLEDTYLKERAHDFRDLGQRILAHLTKAKRNKPKYPKNCIIIGEEIPAAIFAEFAEGQLSGIVSVNGSSNSHVAILARALGIPTVMGAKGISLESLDQAEVIVDGYYGEVYVHPSQNVRKEFIRLSGEEKQLHSELETLRDLPATTPDGHTISLFVNTGLAADVTRALKVGAEGVGLFRTEISFMMRDRFPSEEEQRILYRQLLNTFAPRPVTMRVLDIGGDKNLPYFPIEEANPFLGWRGIRITLDHPEIFLVQVRAMLRASIDLNNLRVMLPMISGIAEIESAMRLINQAFRELKMEGYQIQMPEVGVMIEIPSTIYQIDKIAARVDFLSVGSNDLTQYLLAVDRNNARVSNLYDCLHPAVLTAINSIVSRAKGNKIPLSICGEIAGDPIAAVLWLAMGYDSLSMSAINLPKIKWVLRKFTMSKAKTLLSEVLAMDDAKEIRCHLECALEEAGLGGLIRAGK